MPADEFADFRDPTVPRQGPVMKMDAEEVMAERELDLLERRAAAIEVGRRMGEETAAKQGEDADVAAQRIARAMAYAAWEFDGKPAGVWTEYCAMFGVTTHVVTHQDDRDPYALLLSESERRAKKKS